MTDETKMEKMAIESREKWGNEYVSSDDDELWDFIYVRESFEKGTGRCCCRIPQRVGIPAGVETGSKKGLHFFSGNLHG